MSDVTFFFKADTSPSECFLLSNRQYRYQVPIPRTFTIHHISENTMTGNSQPKTFVFLTHLMTHWRVRQPQCCNNYCQDTLLQVFFFLEVAVASINSSKVPDTLKSSWYWPKTGYRNSLLPSLNSSVTKRCNAHVNRIIWSDQVTYFLTLLLLSNLGFTDLCLVQFCKVCTPIILYFYYYLL